MPETAALRLENEPDFDLRYPPLPRSARNISVLLAKGEEAPGPDRLLEIVGTDPTVAAAVLRRVNSAYYGVRRPVSGVRQAILLLGSREVCNLVLTAWRVRLEDVLRCEEQAYIFERILRTSIAAAYFSELLAGALDVRGRPAAFAAGLLHNVGRLVFLYNAPDTYEALWYAGRDGEAPESHDERRIFGVGHGDLGYAATEAWRLPNEICIVARDYMRPGAAEPAALRGLVYAASVAASAGAQLVRFAEETAGTSEPAGDLAATEWSFCPPACLPALEGECGVSRSVPVGLVEGNADQALRYVRAMTL